MADQAPTADQSDSQTTTKRRIRKRTGTTRERTGCVTCRRRKKKCTNEYPVCDHCRRLNFECIREEPRQAVVGNGKPAPGEGSANGTAPETDTTVLATSSSTVLAVPTSTWAAPILSLDPVATYAGTAGDGSAPTSRRLLLRYYLQTLSTLLTSTLENNCFASVFLPMATESPMLLNAIIAHSSSHLSLRDKSYEVLALQSRSNALSSLASSLSSTDRDPELDLSCCLVLCSMESILGDTSKWYNHLVGASQIIRATSGTMYEDGQLSSDQLAQFFNTFEGRWLKRNFAYHDALHTVTMNTRPLISGYYWQAADDEAADSYFGLASRIIYVISEISVLNADMADASAAFAKEASKSDFSSRAQRLEIELQEWTPPECQDVHLKAMAETYRNAALIHLYRVLRRHLPDLTQALNRKMATPVQGIVEAVEKMPVRCLPETTLLFPLFMAGGETDQAEQIRIIRQRMLDIVNYRHFHNVEVALTVLDELWRLRAGNTTPGNGQRRIDWIDVLARRRWRLALT
ncbi:putative c6 transcription factor [Diplodia seriata]|uniref:Putative c6 transcription factor n=1 Tax=Diplodia seriata TaxID=420778 RepID=A0A0G2ECF7_9PEZI|nr:putative c6 transcription factor [Diplodia seriata]